MSDQSFKNLVGLCAASQPGRRRGAYTSGATLPLGTRDVLSWPVLHGDFRAVLFISVAGLDLTLWLVPDNVFAGLADLFSFM